MIYKINAFFFKKNDRKSKLEEQLKEIEKSIDKFNQPNIIISS